MFSFLFFTRSSRPLFFSFSFFSFAPLPQSTLLGPPFHLSMKEEEEAHHKLESFAVHLRLASLPRRRTYGFVTRFSAMNISSVRAATSIHGSGPVTDRIQFFFFFNGTFTMTLSFTLQIESLCLSMSFAAGD